MSTKVEVKVSKITNVNGIYTVWMEELWSSDMYAINFISTELPETKELAFMATNSTGEELVNLVDGAIDDVELVDSIFNITKGELLDRTSKLYCVDSVNSIVLPEKFEVEPTTKEVRGSSEYADEIQLEWMFGDSDELVEKHDRVIMISSEQIGGDYVVVLSNGMVHAFDSQGDDINSKIGNYIITHPDNIFVIESLAWDLVGFTSIVDVDEIIGADEDAAFDIFCEVYPVRGSKAKVIRDKKKEEEALKAKEEEIFIRLLKDKVRFKKTFNVEEITTEEAMADIAKDYLK